jgi:hypothetical protein
MAHQHVGVDLDPIPFHTLLQPAHRPTPVLLATENRLGLIAAGRDMVKGSRELGSQSSHDKSILILRTPTCRNQALTSGSPLVVTQLDNTISSHVKNTEYSDLIPCPPLPVLNPATICPISFLIFPLCSCPPG